MKELETILANLVEKDDPRNNPPKTPKTSEITCRAFTTELRSIDEKARTIEFVASTEAVDRYGDIIRVAGWKYENYLKNPVFLWGHRSGDPPIGRTVELRRESNPPALVQKVQFADKATYAFADTIFNLYKNGFMRAVSVGFRPLEDPTPIFEETTGHTTGYEFTSQELLELSAVPIPANPQALARNFDGLSDAELEQIFRDPDAPADETDVERLRKALLGLLDSVERLLDKFTSSREPKKREEQTEDDSVNKLLAEIVHD